MSVWDQVQQIAAKPVVALTSSGGASFLTFLQSSAEIIGLLGQICTGLLAILLLLNWLYVKRKG